MTTENITIDSNVEAIVADNATVENAAVNEANETTVDNGSKADAIDPAKELETVRKALDKRNRYNNNLRQRIRTLESEKKALEESRTKNSVSAPSMDGFDSVLDYMKADNNYTLEQKLAEHAHSQKVAEIDAQKRQAIEQQTKAIETQVYALIQSNPDVQRVFQGNAEILSQMPEHVEQLMLEIDDTPAAIYALAKEGRLQDLYYMPTHIAAAHLVQAEIRGQQYLLNAQKTKTQTVIPEPLKSLRGTGKPTNKPLESMDSNELMKWLNN